MSESGERKPPDKSGAFPILRPKKAEPPRLRVLDGGKNLSTAAYEGKASPSRTIDKPRKETDDDFWNARNMIIASIVAAGIAIGVVVYESIDSPPPPLSAPSLTFD